MNCDLDIIGITNTECECFTPDIEPPLSNVYLSELDGFSLQLLKDTEICEKGDYQQHATEAINSAKIQLFQDLQNALTRDFERVPLVKGLIGYDKKLSVVNTTKTHLVYRMVLNPLKSTTVTIKGVGVAFQNNTPVVFRVYDRFGTQVHTFTVTPTAGKYKYQALTFSLPCVVKGTQFAEYFIVADISANKPHEFKHVCCGDTYRFSYSKPCFQEVAAGWRSIAMLGYNLINFDVNNIDRIREQDALYKTFAGILFDIESLCAQEEMICSEEIDYQNTDWGVGIALALRYKTGAILYTDILNRPNVDLKTPESLLASVAYWEQKYNEFVNYMTSTNEVLRYSSCWRLKRRMKRVAGRL
jgi:hypothetical protein